MSRPLSHSMTCYNFSQEAHKRRSFGMLETIPAGIYPPLPTFFTDDEELDLATLRRHVQALNGSGITGYVVMGSNGESVHLSGDERAQIIETVRAVADPEMPLIAGCGEQSTRASIANCRQAAASGADMALILPGFYFKSRMNNAALLAHYRAIADSSPLPVVIYNMPANAAGLYLDADGQRAAISNGAVMREQSGVVHTTLKIEARQDQGHIRARGSSLAAVGDARSRRLLAAARDERHLRVGDGTHRLNDLRAFIAAQVNRFAVGTHNDVASDAASVQRLYVPPQCRQIKFLIVGKKCR